MFSVCAVEKRDRRLNKGVFAFKNDQLVIVSNEDQNELNLLQTEHSTFIQNILDRTCANEKYKICTFCGTVSVCVCVSLF